MSKPLTLLKRLTQIGLVLVVITAPTQYSFEVAKKTYLSVVDPLIWLACIPWALERLKSGKWKNVRLPLMPVLLVVVAALSILESIDLVTSLKDIFQRAEYFIAVFLLFSYGIEGRRELKFLLVVFLCTATVVILFGLVHYLHGATPDFDVRATFGNRNVLGGFLSIVLPLMYGIALFDRNRFRRAGYILVILTGFGIVLSGGTLLGLLISFAILSVIRGRVAFLACTTACLLGLVFVLPRLPRGNAEVLHQSIQIFDDNGNATDRYKEWQAAVGMIRENPLLGVGIGNYQSHIGAYYGVIERLPGVMEHDSQNMYLVEAASIGLLGLICLVGLLSFYGIKAIRTHFDAEAPFAKGLALGLFGALLAFSINGIWSPLLVRGMGVPLAIVFAWSEILARTEAKRPDTGGLLGASGQA